MYIEIRVQWNIHKMDCDLKINDNYKMMQESLDYKNNVHISHYCIQYI